jgi:transcriptional regulator with XRE-family HTH domain
MDCTEIGNRISELRQIRGISQAELAKNFNVNREVVTKWETGTRDLKTEYTIKLADYFGVTCDYILRGLNSENVDTNKKLGLPENAIQSLHHTKEMRKDYKGDFLNRFIESNQLHINIASIVDYLINYDFPDMAIPGNTVTSDMLYVEIGLYGQLQKEFIAFIEYLVKENKTLAQIENREKIKKMFGI